jgi:hypothetical protein
MPEETGVGEAAQVPGRTPRADRRRFSIPMIIAAVIMFLAMASYFVIGVITLFAAGLVSAGLAGTMVAAGALTAEGRLLVVACLYLFYGVLGLVVLVGFLLKRRRAWSAAMTWTAVSLATSLVSYFKGEPRYLTMLGGVVLLLVLNQASLHREFHIERR